VYLAQRVLETERQRDEMKSRVEQLDDALKKARVTVRDLDALPSGTIARTRTTDAYSTICLLCLFLNLFIDIC